MLECDITQRAVDQFQETEISEGLGAMGWRVVPLAVLGRGRMIIAINTVVSFRAQVEIDRTIEDWQMTQAQRFTCAMKLRRLLPALVTDRLIVCELKID